MEDWALIRRLVADGVPQRQVARDLGVARATVARAVARAVASQRSPKYERPAVATAFTPFEAHVQALQVEHPALPATVLAERVGWSRSITWFRDNVRRVLLPDSLPRPGPLDRSDKWHRAAHLRAPPPSGADACG